MSEEKEGHQTLQEAIEACRCQEEGEPCSLQESSQVITPQSRRQLRALAFHYLYVAESFGYDIAIDDIVESFANDYKVRVEGTDFPTELAKGVVAHRDRYAGLIEPLLENWRFDRIGCCTRLILYMALWEFEQPEAVSSIVINEAVELAKAFAEKDAYRFVNGILDQAKKNYPEAVARDAANAE